MIKNGFMKAMYAAIKMNALLILSYGMFITILLVEGRKYPSALEDEVTGERILNQLKSNPALVVELFHTLLQLSLDRLSQLEKPSEFDDIHSDTAYLFRAMKRTKQVADKKDMVKKVTDYFRRSSLYTGKYRHTYTSNFGAGFDKIRTTSNGDCFYSAISLLFFGHEHFVQGLRAITAAHIALNEPFFIALNAIFYEDDLTWLKVLDNGHFAESIEIIFLSNILCRPIKIYESGGRRWYQNPLVSCKSPKEPLHLLLEDQHFSALRIKPDFSPVEADIIQLHDLPPLKIL